MLSMVSGASSHAFPVFRASSEADAVLVFSNGAYFIGKGLGSFGLATGELCFNTAMSGYQEVLTDPSYAGQIVNFTFSHIGNVGCNAGDAESSRPYCTGAVFRCAPTEPSNFRSETSLEEWLAKHGTIAIAGVDTRAVTQRIREDGSVGALICRVKPGETIDINDLTARAASLTSLKGVDLAAKICVDKALDLTGRPVVSDPNKKRYRVAAIDYGVKQSILRYLAEAGTDVTLFPADASFDAVMAHNPDGVFLSNGPADPLAVAPYAVPVIRRLLDAGTPLFGVCMGYQLMALASGLKTEKMHAGHRGANHPVKNLQTGKVEITAQNHGFCVSQEDVPPCAEITHVSLFDGTAQGMRRLDKPAFSVQYHPESSPGPHDARYLFDEFYRLIAQACGDATGDSLS